MRLRQWVVIFTLLLGRSALAQTTADLRAEVEVLRKELQTHEDSKTPIGELDERLSGRYGPNADVVSKNKLRIGGLLQIWFQSPQKDHIANSTQQLFFPAGNATPEIRPETNRGNRNDTFRVRRAELHFGFDLNDHISAFVLLDPARESNLSFYPLPTFPKHNSPYEVSPALRDGYIPAKSVQPHLLQDAYINVFGIIPHHTITIGQFKPPAGEEAFRNSGQLDFVERAMVTGINNIRDDGAMISGTWWQDRLKYSIGAFNGPSGSVLSDPEITEAGNRPDDNNEKDIAERIAGRPVWDLKRWFGRLEVGYARTDGVHGGKGQEYDPDFSLVGLNRQRTAISRQSAWAWYRPNGPVKGWWLRGEWGTGHDRFGSGALTSFLGTGSVDLGANGPRGGNGFTQRDPSPVDVQGWFFSTGYYMPESIFTENLKKGGTIDRMLTKMEFAFRYEVYQNIAMEDLVNPDRHTDLFKTQAFTAGVNYYLEGRGVKLQANYIVVVDPTSPGQPLRGLRKVQNDVFVVNFQSSF